MAEGVPPSVEQGTLPVKTKSSISRNRPSTSRFNQIQGSLYGGSIGGQNHDVLLDSGASCSVICKEYAPLKDVEPLMYMKLVNADGSDLALLGTLVLEVKLETLNLIIHLLSWITSQFLSSWAVTFLPSMEWLWTLLTIHLVVPGSLKSAVSSCSVTQIPVCW